MITSHLVLTLCNRALLFASLAVLLCGPIKAQQPPAESRILFTICNYCIEAKRVGVPLMSGGMRDLSYTLFTRLDAPSLNTGVHAARPGHVLGVSTQNLLFVSTTQPPDTAILALQSDFVSFRIATGTTDANGERYAGIAHIRTRDGSRYSNWLRTDSVCVGGQFKPPSYQFIAVDDRPMAPIPYNISPPNFSSGPTKALDISGASQFIFDFPPDGPTICEGELIPANTFFKDYAERQIAAALGEFRERSNDLAIRKIVEETTRRQIGERFEELAAIIANAVQEGKLKPSVPSTKK